MRNYFDRQWGGGGCVITTYQHIEGSLFQLILGQLLMS